MTLTLLPPDSLPDAGGLLHGAVARPSLIDWGASGRQAPRLLSVDREHALRLPGVVDVVVRRSFVGVVARNAVAARYAVGMLRLQWEMPSGRPSPWEQPGAELAPNAAATESAQVAARYRWPLRPRGATARVVAQWRPTPEGDGLCVWVPLADFGRLHADLAALLEIDPILVTLVAAPGETLTDYATASAAADAALLARAARRPVAVDCLPEDGVGGAWWHTSDLASSGADGAVTRFALRAQGIPPQAAPIALLLTETAGAARHDDRDAFPPSAVPYRFAEVSVESLSARGSAPVSDPACALRESLVFAQESHLDELARVLGEDPVQLRLPHLDGRGSALVRQVAARAEWRASGSSATSKDGLAMGRGFAYAQLSPDAASNTTTWSAWVVDVQVDAHSGHVEVTRVVMGHEADDGRGDDVARAQLQAHAELLAQRLVSAPDFDSWSVAGRSLSPASLGSISGDVAHPEVQDLQPLLLSQSGAMLPAAAAVANAIFDATGVRMREPPFAGERLLGELRDRGIAGRRSPSLGRTSAWAACAALIAGAAAMLPWGGATRPIAPVAPLVANLYSDATLERGRLVAAAGDCVACHTAPGGLPNAGGLGLPTPFGTIYTTNLTPDAATGIGTWSYAAFERAMRHGVSRDGHRLYPAFPYTSFARMTEEDLQSLYAYLMAQAPVRNEVPSTQLPFPFGLRPLLAGWNLAFHDSTPFKSDPGQSVAWNRGAYLVNGVGHCGACHTPRNALGAERTGKAFLAGGEAEGWQAPALRAASRAPVPWTEAELFRYLRFGSSLQHGPAAGPMRQVIHGLAELPEDDVRAIAHYLANPPGVARPATTAEADAVATVVQQRSDELAGRLIGPGSRLYEAACATCHDPGPGGLMSSAKLPLAFNTNLHDARPDNLVQVLLHGMEPAQPTLGGSMPAFADTFDDRQIAELAHYLRARFAPGRERWTDVEAGVARVRAQGDLSSGH